MGLGDFLLCKYTKNADIIPMGSGFDFRISMLAHRILSLFGLILIS